MTLIEIVPIVCAGIFAGAALYISLVQHPAAVQAFAAPEVAALLSRWAALHWVRSIASLLSFLTYLVALTAT